MENFNTAELFKNVGLENEYAKYLDSLDKSKKSKQQKKDKRNRISIIYSLLPLSIFRYTLSMLLVIIKLGLLTYLPINPLVNLSWVWVFFPAVCVEVGLFSIIVIIILIATVGMGIYFGMVGLASLWKKFANRKEMKHDERAEQLIRELEN